MAVKVLVVDDEEDYRIIIQEVLRGAGMDVRLAKDGEEGLRMLKEKPCDIVLVDWMMPRLDGYQTCALIKNHPHFRNIPVVMLTSKDTLFDRARAKLAGSDQYLIKPFTKNSLVETIVAQARQSEESHDGN